MHPMKAGTAWRDITPDHPINIFGQMHIRNGEYTRDPLTVNAAVFEDAGRCVAIVSADVCVIPDKLAPELRKLVAAGVAGKIDQADVIIHSTHTHVAPCTSGGIIGEIDPAWLASFKQAIVDAVAEAFKTMADVTLWSGNGHIEQMGWNRRGLSRHGKCEMYYGSWNKDFVGIEGPRDGHVGLIWAKDSDNNVKIVISSFSTHPNCLEGESFYSADLPGEVRKVLRGSLGKDVGVIYLTGAAGDTAPSVMVNNEKRDLSWRGDAGVKRSALYLGGEMLKTIALAQEPMAAQKVGAAHRTLQIPMRPWDTNFEPEKLPESGMKKFCVDSKNDWDRLMREENPVAVPVHVVRLGDAAICFNPSELFCEFGLAIKAQSPASATLIGELTDGWVGYIPTPHAIGHGGYSARSSSHTRLVPDAGWQIVNNTTEMLGELFDSNQS